MDVQRAKELLAVLADGVDPLTGEVLPDDHVCNKGEIVRALHCAVEELSRRRKKPLPENNGKPWTEELDDELCRLFDGGMKNHLRQQAVRQEPQWGVDTLAPQNGDIGQRGQYSTGGC